MVVEPGQQSFLNRFERRFMVLVDSCVCLKEREIGNRNAPFVENILKTCTFVYENKFKKLNYTGTKVEGYPHCRVSMVYFWILVKTQDDTFLSYVPWKFSLSYFLVIGLRLSIYKIVKCQLLDI